MKWDLQKVPIRGLQEGVVPFLEAPVGMTQRFAWADRKPSRLHTFLHGRFVAAQKEGGRSCPTIREGFLGVHWR